MQENNIEKFIYEIPKAELHIHIEGSLELELMLKIAARNNISLKYSSYKELKAAYNFHNLQSFLDIYFDGVTVLLHEEDFYDLTLAYLKKAREQNICHVEVFFDPQLHTTRGVSFESVISGISKALQRGEDRYGISSGLIMCFLRHLSVESAMETLDESVKFKDKIIGVGLDSNELGNPPSKFIEVFKKASSLEYLTVAHAGEEGPATYIWEALDKLNVSRIDHGVRCLEDKTLIRELLKREVPLTICPLSNVKLSVFKTLEEHNLKELLDHGLIVTVNSDDPAFFDGYVVENMLYSQKALNLTKKDIYTLARNSFSASFLSKEKKDKLLSKLDSFVKAFEQAKVPYLKTVL